MRFSSCNFWRCYTLLVVGLIIAMVAVILTGCDDEDYYDYVPPAGKGSLVIDNNTFDDILLYVDGVYTTKVNDGSERILDYDPGLYRITLIEDEGSRNYRGDTDILEGRLTILDVIEDVNDLTEYDVLMEFD